MNYKGNKQKTAGGKKGGMWILSVFFLALHIFFALQNVSSGLKLANLEKQQAETVKINKEMKSKLIEATSLIKAQEESPALGFTNPEKTIYLTTLETVAKLP